MEYTQITIYGDKYFLRKTFDIVDYHGDIDGFEVMDENENFLFQFDGGTEEDVIKEIKWRIYRERWAFVTK